MDFATNIAGHALEYFDSTHTYLVDGKIVPSITQMLSKRFGHKYDGISDTILNEAARKGTEVHKAIEDYCTTGQECDLPELRNFKFLQRVYGFHVEQNEVPVILFDGEPIAAGRLDLVLSMNGWRGLADIKRTSVLDKNYLAHQLNLYRLAYEQSYGEKIEFLRGVHLRNDVRRFVEIPIAETFIKEFINEWRANND